MFSQIFKTRNHKLNSLPLFTLGCIFMALVILFACGCPGQSDKPTDKTPSPAATESPGATRSPDASDIKAEEALRGCNSNLKNIGTALEMYSVDAHGRYPHTMEKLVPDYLKLIPTCPAAGTDTYAKSYTYTTIPDRYTMFCSGHYHENAGLKENHPQYNSVEGLIDKHPSPDAGQQL